MVHESYVQDHAQKVLGLLGDLANQVSDANAHLDTVREVPGELIDINAASDVDATLTAIADMTRHIEALQARLRDLERLAESEMHRIEAHTK